MSVLIETSLGDIVIDLYTEECPLTTKNFLKLCKIKYYNYNVFHKVEQDFIAQTGDPTETGKGGQSVYGLVYGEQAKYFQGEIVPTLKHDAVGVVSMTNMGEGLCGSQFFLTLSSNLDYLDQKNAVFGQVTEGIDVLETINESFVDDDKRPLKDIRILHTVVLDDPFEDPRGLEVPSESPPPTETQMASMRIAFDEDEDGEHAADAEALEKERLEREARSRAEVLEMIGDLPDADVRPPDNVLFVCKLNSVTQDADLELIFSRFGDIESCEIIRDRQSGDSLCFAFIEFKDESACIDAYFKMDNVLIDDRRIHVDFSQSVSRLWNKYSKGGADFKNLGAAKSKHQYAVKGASNHGEMLLDEPISEMSPPKRRSGGDRREVQRSARKHDSDHRASGRDNRRNDRDYDGRTERRSDGRTERRSDGRRDRDDDRRKDRDYDVRKDRDYYGRKERGSDGRRDRDYDGRKERGSDRKKERDYDGRRERNSDGRRDERNDSNRGKRTRS